MRRLQLFALPVAALLAFTAPAWGADGHWPAAVPEPAGWTYESPGTGAEPKLLVLANASVEYALYSSPERPFLYGLSNYKVTPHRRTGLFARLAENYRGREVVFWIDGPEIRIFVRVSHRRAWLIRRWTWTELPPRSPAWMAEQSVVLRLWSVHALVKNHGADHAVLQF